MSIRGPDAEIVVERAARMVWLAQNRDGHAFYAPSSGKLACDLMDDPAVWKAVSAIEGELFSGLLRVEPSDPRPGDSVKFVMPGERAEELIASAGIVRQVHMTHQCGPACVRASRKVSAPLGAIPGRMGRGRAEECGMTHLLHLGMGKRLTALGSLEGAARR